jgi:hypothetical protein
MRLRAGGTDRTLFSIVSLLVSWRVQWWKAKGEIRVVTHSKVVFWVVNLKDLVFR